MSIVELSTREHDDSVIRIETYKNPIQVLKASASITDRMLREEPQKASEYAIRAMASRFAEIIAPYMVVQTSYDPVYQQHNFHAMLKVVVPKEGVKNWIEEES